MKRKLFIIAAIVAGSLAFSSASAQVHISVGINESTYPGYTYYTYPAWHGHYRDRVYYEHYHDRFYREHKTYFRDHNHFDHDRWDRAHHRNHHR